MPEEGQKYPTYHKKIWEISDKAAAQKLEAEGFVFSHFADGSAHFHHPCRADDESCKHENAKPGEWKAAAAKERVVLMAVTPKGEKEAKA